MSLVELRTRRGGDAGSKIGRERQPGSLPTRPPYVA
jgi:hypothetical protein